MQNFWWELSLKAIMAYGVGFWWFSGLNLSVIDCDFLVALRKRVGPKFLDLELKSTGLQ